MTIAKIVSPDGNTYRDLGSCSWKWALTAAGRAARATSEISDTCILIGEEVNIVIKTTLVPGEKGSRKPSFPFILSGLAKGRSKRGTDQFRTRP